MRDIDLFQQALGLPKPWYVERSEFNASSRRLDLYLDFETGGTFVCPECGRAGCKAYDTSEKTWRHLNFFQHEAYLHARVPRVECEQCGVKLVEVTWARPGSGFTLLFEAIVLMLAKSMPIAEVSRLLGEHDTKLWRVVHHYVDEARERTDFSAVRQVGVDETASKRGHNYITLFVDLEEPKLLFATEGRDSATIGAFREDLEAHGGSAEQVEEFCLDMSPAYRKGLDEHFPEARITFDKFHLVKLMNEAVDEVRRQEARMRPELKGTRYLWLKNPLQITRKQMDQYDRLWLPGLHLKTVRAYHIRLAFQDLWTQPRLEAETFLKKWYAWAIRSRLAPVVRFARTIREHWDGVLNWFQTRISNGVLEGFNSLLQAAKAKARGYRSVRNLIAMAYLIMGKLDIMTLPI
ncbi:MAG: ISL3 family transposase [Gammaproteobacteria bacterium]